MKVKTVEVHKTRPEHVKAVGDRTLHVLDVDGATVKVIVTAKGTGYAMEVEAADLAVAEAAMALVAKNPLGLNRFEADAATEFLMEGLSS
jgi:hypothetical protein